MGGIIIYIVFGYAQVIVGGIHTIPLAREKTESDTELRGTYATEGSFQVEDLSPPEFPEVNISVEEDHGGPDPYQFVPLAPAAAVMPDTGALSARALSGALLLSVTPANDESPSAYIWKWAQGYTDSHSRAGVGGR